MNMNDNHEAEFTKVLDSSPPNWEPELGLVSFETR